MAFGIIKPGQGYWMRIMTACLIACFTLFSAGWLARQTGRVIENMDKSTWALGVGNIQGTPPAPGAQINLFKRAEGGAGGPEVSIGTATLVSFDAQDRLVQINNIALNDRADVNQVVAIVSGDPAAGGVRASVSSHSGLPPVEPLYAQGAVAGVVIIIGTILAYWLAGTRQASVDFLIDTDYEMKKVNWSTPREIMGSTTVVIFGFLFIAAALFVFDYLLQLFFKSIDIIQTSTNA